ncbi:Hpt domain-containing protein [Derxia gummosa]|uniref:Chemotaxis protein CheA n=1 Tax=Derxia gummosa DSM 723 TaxID=1121388 RepID=A0A8B6X9U9_9BURK|nr:Hpt domain-containing protein [Derxia gummosa]
MTTANVPTGIDTGPLSWVIDEVRQALDSSLTGLRNFASHPDEATPLRMARTHLHQAHGALQMVDLDGVSQITALGERAFDRFTDAPELCTEANVAIIDSAFHGLVEYLDDLLAGQPHQPVRLYPQYRDLAALVGIDRAHPADLFFPNLAERVLDDDACEPVDEPARLAPARASYERGLLKLLRNIDPASAAAEMGRAVRNFRAAQTPGAARSFWTVLHALCEGIADGSVAPSDLHLKRLAARVNMQMRRAVNGQPALAERLLADALFHLSASDSPSPEIARVRNTFRLASVPRDYEHAHYGRVDARVVKRAKEQLGAVRSSWDRYVGGKAAEAESLLRQARMFGELAGELGEPGIATVSAAVTGVAETCAAAPGVATADLAIETATAILFLEHGLDTFNRLSPEYAERADTIAARLRHALAGEPSTESVAWLAELSREAHERSTMATLVNEIQTNLRAIEQALDAFFRDPSRRDGLGNCAALLAQSAGALALLDHETAHQAMEDCRAAIERFADPTVEADPAEFDRVAQTFGALGFVVDSLRQPTGAPHPELERDPERGGWRVKGVETPRRGLTETVPPPLHIRPEAPTEQPAEVTLAPLAPDEPFAELTEVVEVVEAAAPPEEGEAGIDGAHASVENELRDCIAGARAAFDRLRAAPDDAARAAELRGLLTQIRQDADLVDDARLQTAAANAIALAGQLGPEGSIEALGLALAGLDIDSAPATVAAPDAATLALAAADDETIDAELLDIFLGEAREVLDTIDAALGRCKGDPGHQGNLTTLRRSFHTLKGSSRMVGLRQFGEAGWAMEQVYNLWLAEERPGDPALFGLTHAAHRQMGSWIDQIAAGQVHAVQPDRLIAAADRVRAGEHFFLTGENTFAAPDSPVYPAPPYDHEPSFDPDFKNDDGLYPGFRFRDEIGPALTAETGDAPADSGLAPPPADAPLAAPVDVAGTLPELPAARLSPDLEALLSTPPEPGELLDLPTGFLAGSSLVRGMAHEPGVDLPVEAAQHEAAPQAATDEVTLTTDPPADGASGAVGMPTPDGDAQIPDGACPATEAHLHDDTAPVDAPAPDDSTPTPEAALPVEAAMPNAPLPAADDPADPATTEPDPPSAGFDDFAEAEARHAQEVSLLQTDLDPLLPLDTADADGTDLALPEPVADAEPPAVNPDERRIGPLVIPTQLYEIYLAEADDCLRILQQEAERWRHFPDGRLQEPAVRSAHSLAGCSATAGLIPVHELAGCVEKLLQAARRGHIVPVSAEFDTLEAALDGLAAMLHRFAAGVHPDAEPALIARVHELALRWNEIADAGERTPAIRSAETRLDDFGADLDLQLDIELPVDGVAPDATQHVGFAPKDLFSRSIGSIDLDLSALADEPVASPEGAAAQPAIARPVGTASVVSSVVAAMPPGIATAGAAPAPRAAKQEEKPARARADDIELPDDEIDPDLIDIFIEEGRDYMPRIEQGLQALIDMPADDARLAAVLRALHTVKGSARMAGAMRLGALCHDIESRAEAARETPTAELFDDLLHRFDNAYAEFARLSGEESVFETAPDEPLPGNAAFAAPAGDAIDDDRDAQAIASDTEPASHVAFGAVAGIGRAPDDVAPREAGTALAGASSDGGAHDTDAATLDVSPPPMPDPAPAPSSFRWPVAPLTDPDGPLYQADDVREPVQPSGAAEPVASDTGAVTVAGIDIGASADGAAVLASSDEASRADAIAAAAAMPPPAQPVASSVALAQPVAVSAPAAAAQAAAQRQQRQQALVRVRSDLLDRLVNNAGEVSIARARLENDLGTVKGALGDLTDNVDRLRAQLREIEIAAEAQMSSRMEAEKEAGRSFDPLEFDRFSRLQELTRMLAESVSDVQTLQQNIVKGMDGANKGLLGQARLTRELQEDLMRVRMVPVDSAAERLYRVVRQSAKEVGKRVNLELRGATVELDRGVLERMTGPFEHLLRNSVVHGIESRERRVAAGKPEAGTIVISVRQRGNEVELAFEDDGAGIDVNAVRAKAIAKGLIAADAPITDAQVAELVFAPGFTTATEVTSLAGRGVGMDVVRAEAGALGGRVLIDNHPGQGVTFTIRLPLTLAVTQVVLVRAGGRLHAIPAVLVGLVQQLRSPQLVAAYNSGRLDVGGQPADFAYLPALLGDHDSHAIAQRYSPVMTLESGDRRVALHVDEVVGNQEVVVKNIGPQLARMVGITGATVLGSGDVVLIIDPVQLVERLGVTPRLPTGVGADAVASVESAVPVDAADAGEAGGVASVAGVAPAAQPVGAPRAVRPRAADAALAALPVAMVVDDSITVRRVTQRLLQREGYQVVLAKDGVDALEQLQEFRPDVMLVDIEMPRMDGFDLTRNVRSDSRIADVPIVMITSRTADKHRNHALELGVNAYLGKPYREDELLAVMRGLIEAHRAAAEEV